MNFIKEYLLKPMLSAVVFLLTTLILVYAASTISSLGGNNIESGDTIGSGWFQEVNDKLVNVKIYNGSGIVSEYVKGKQQLCIGTDCRSDWPSGGSSVWSTGTAKIYYQSGDVGIGTNVPNQNLHIKENNGNAEIDIESEGVSNHWGIYQDKSTEQLRFWNNDDRVIISSGGDVGIGTTNSNASLDVQNGGVFIGDKARGEDADGVLGVESKIRLGANDGNYLYMNGNQISSYNSTGSSNDLYLNINGGNVGIGTNTPDSSLTILGDSESAVDELIHLNQPGTDLGKGSRITFLNGLGGGIEGVNHQSSRGRFSIVDNNDNSVLTTITEDNGEGDQGNVGIGTIDPGAPFEIGDANSNYAFAKIEGVGAGLRLNRTDNGGSAYISLKQSGATNGREYKFLSRDTGNFVLYDQTASVERMTINSSGNVGIGTTSPSTRLDIGKGNISNIGSYNMNIVNWDSGYNKVGQGIKIGGGVFDPSNKTYRGFSAMEPGSSVFFPWGHDGDSDYALFYSPSTPSDNSNDARLYITDDGDGSSRFSIWGNSCDSDCHVLSGSSELFRFSDDGNFLVKRGNIGIGTTSPSYRLDVEGDIEAVDVHQTSDKRYKKDVKNLEKSLEKITSLSGVKFKWRNDKYEDKNFKEGEDIGLIAQDIEKVFPELVSENKDGYKSVSYSKIIAPLIESVKALKQIDKKKEEEIKQLRQENQLLKQGLCEVNQEAEICK